MTRPLFVLLLLAGCGVAGPPEPPPRELGPSVTISGSAGIGVTGG